ncbi:hypothetical protein AGABI1DRAFT_105074 [Agaricus bisporus var. burnettii JB137-S8]|uniref:MYND-type domain-containing protein n=1 Tax=Agaricus bisporus var. burnettii (strain JB137-S8 / ATCC MYA-4627 / FGSC 10392) TaxID=597362 RepID=K5Y123_AGABU|nr:uncharacterized protein AGABI1DRAFT_105074 [Agaricus bisporus var. burnettii JB137-S8]EKM81505.1 hypothetical protein AGABI1DRAFT_105074 [Agaricus bisporus var. burnettii JB137-S8]
MSATEDESLSREDVMHVLKGMNIEFSPNTKLTSTTLRHRLIQSLDAAQRFASIFPDPTHLIKLSRYSMWRKKAPVVDAFSRRTWGAIFQDNRGFEDHRQIAFARINQLIPDIAKEMDKKKIGYVVLKDMATLRALIIRFFAIYEINDRTPLLLVNYACLEEDDEEALDDTITDYTPEEQRGRAYQMTDIEQDLLIELLSLNRGHLSPEYKITEAAFDDRCEVGFILPIGGLNVKDIIRLSKPKGCLLCGEETHSTCSACLSAQYCGKGEKEDWRNHKSLCKAISSGKWYTIELDPNPFSTMMSKMYKTSINRYDDTDDDTPTHNAEGVEEPPPNPYEDDYYLVKLQVPIGAEANQMLVHDRYKTFELHLTDMKNPEAFTAAMLAVALEPKMYRWAHREGEWNWKICFDRLPDQTPTW